jgi:UDP-3-O-[3-hydroxymyristoyl] glucosamine N-acyltransferase
VDTTCVDNTASIGPEVSFSSDVIIAPRATLGGRLNHASNPLPVATGVIVARQATVGVDHILGADTFIGRSSTAGADLTTLTDVSVGYAAQLGHDVTLGANAVVGNLVQVGDYTSLGTNAIVARSTTIANAASSGQGTVINGIVGPDVSIEADVRVEQGARVRKQAMLLEGARIEATARIGRGARVEAGATVHGTVQTNTVVGAGATVGSGAIIRRGGELCAATVLADDASVGSGETYPSTGCGAGLAATDPGLSCLDILTQAPSSPSADYWVDPNGGDPSDSFNVQCDMDTRFRNRVA